MKQFAIHTVFESAQSAANEILTLSTVSKEWHQAAHHNNLWKLLTLRISPAAPFIAEFNEEENEDEKKNKKTKTKKKLEDPWKKYYCTPYTDPTKTSALATGLLDIESWESLFRQRTMVGMHAEKNYRTLVETDVPHPYGGHGDVHFLTCTTLDENRSNKFIDGEASFGIGNLTFIWEVYELEGCNTSRSETIRERIQEEQEEDEITGSGIGGSGIDYYPQEPDYLTSKQEHLFASNPHFSPHRVSKDKIHVENLVMTATVSGSESGPSVHLPANSRFSIPFDMCMDSCNFSMWRVVVTVHRDTDDKMCQIVDIRGTEDIDGFNEPDGDSQMGFAQFRVSEGTEDQPDFGQAFDKRVVEEVLDSMIEAIEELYDRSLHKYNTIEETAKDLYLWEYEKYYGEGAWGKLNLSHPLDISVSFGWNKRSSKKDVKNDQTDDEQDNLAMLKQKLHKDHHYAANTCKFFNGFKFEWMDPRDYEDESRGDGLDEEWICAKLESLEWS